MDDLAGKLLEPLLTITEAAEKLNVKPWLLSRAVKRGAVPSYQFLNSRRRVRMSEIVEIIEASKSEVAVAVAKVAS